MKAIFLLLFVALPALAQSTINSTQKYAWAGNTGWLDFRPDTTRGFRFGEFSCAGWIWSPNIGWIDCGDGTPANHINYENNSNTDYGVNHYGTGNLYGMAWSPNTGWINFGWADLDPDNPNRPHVDLTTGQFTGYAWGANTGWISLAGVKTERMELPDTDSDGISDAYEYAYAGNLGTLGADHDQDGDGFSDKQEYLAMTNPLDSGSFFKVTKIEPVNPDGSAIDLTWTSAPNRRYRVECSTDLGVSDPWHLSPLDPAAGFTADSGASTTRTTYDSAAPNRFFRISAVIPLQQ
ncbi:MAG: thrombospondin type 3 repeat-containing protein [Verrucomicrobiota bacterium]